MEGRTGAIHLDPVKVLDEHEAKSRLHNAGMPVPAGCVTSARHAPDIAVEIGFPVAVKMVSDRLPHKTEAGAVALGIWSRMEVEAAVARIRACVTRHDAGAMSDCFLIEKMVGPPVMELLVNVRTDPRFGLAMTLASGGILTELVADAVTILLSADRAVVVDALSRLATHLCREGNDVVEVEINPLFILRGRVCAVDALMRVSGK